MCGGEGRGKPLSQGRLNFKVIVLVSKQGTECVVYVNSLIGDDEDG